MGAARLTDVAARAGVSLATASRVLNGSARTPAEAITRRVRAAATELGYVANAQAQALARSATGLVGLVVHDVADPYFSTIVKGAQRVARDHRSQVLLAGTNRDEQAELDAVAAFASYRTDSIILAGSRGEHSDVALARELGRYVENGGRLVTFGRPAFPGARVVSIDNREGGRQLAAALIERGIENFAILTGPPELVTARDRVAGYLDALTAADLRPLAMVSGDFTSAGGYASGLRCLEDVGPLPGGLCLVVVNDVMALGAITAVRSLRLRVPEDVQVAGFDDIPTLRHYAPSLTTYRLPLEEIGETAATLALSRGGDDVVRVSGEVVLRESAG